ncbi:sterol desaturase family protein [uncultured Roseovarius sp.]|uniref:sterol desaturase family protein n=1 Tax=uncultured Roseovarius sp. TaxID=293344 RepID=UPI002614D3E2|nr:sterol desaturase family protein [uncultured Roseovarius sp.]
MSYLFDLMALYADYIVYFFSFLWDPNSRLFLLYLAVGAGFAFVIYRLNKHHVSGPDADRDSKNFLSFLLPTHVWSHPSAWLDVRYFFFHHLIGHFLLFGVLAGCTTWAYALVTGGANLAEMARLGDMQSEPFDFLIALGYMFAFFVIGDLIGYVIHYLQHKIPILWEFHKVHHSAEVMHPISNFREHPIDNLAYKAAIGAGYGAFIGLASNTLGYVPNMPAVFGVPVLMFVFNLMGYNLRHSHIWLRWPGAWSKIFPSPAHHHVHHSCHPQHFDKNFAFMFPLWDVLFGTYEMPEDNRDVKFGVAGMKSGEMDTCVKLYLVPFKKAFRRLQPREKKPTTKSMPPAE